KVTNHQVNVQFLLQLQPEWQRINRNARYENQRIGNVAGARETVGSTMVQKYKIQCYNCKEFGHVARECQKSKRAKDAAYHREKMLLYQELEAYYMYTAQLQEVSPNAADSGPIFDAEPLQKNDDDNDLTKEQTSNKALIEKLKGEIEDFKNKNISLESSNNFFKEANNRLSETNNLLYAEYKKSEAELARRNSKEYTSQMELECAKVRETKDKLSSHQETIFILSKQKEAQIKLYKTREDKKLEKVIELENKVKVLDNIVYKTGQTVQTMNMLNSKYRTSFAKLEFLKKAQRANPRLYDI
nr:hypothetical protein [Tanacetum cinerariifolium]